MGQVGTPACPAMTSASISTTPRCATARRPRASISAVADKLAIARELDRLGIDYVEGGWPGANPTDDAFFAAAADARARQARRLRHDAAAGPQRRQRSRPRGAARQPAPVGQPGRQDLGLPCRGGARHRARRERRDDRRQRRAWRRTRPARRCSTPSISSTATRPIPAYALACLQGGA